MRHKRLFPSNILNIVLKKIKKSAINIVYLKNVNFGGLLQQQGRLRYCRGTKLSNAKCYC